MGKSAKLDLYLLKHKNSDAAVIGLNKEYQISYIKTIHSALLPPSTTIYGQINKQNLTDWWGRRAVPDYQIMKRNLLSNQLPMEYMINNLALSMVDCYWICPIDKSYTWEKVNFFSNDFEELDFKFSRRESGTSFKPSGTLQGELPKRWMIDGDGTRWLVKGNHGDTSRESLNEVFASLLHKLQGVSYTEYIPVDFSQPVYQNFKMNGKTGCRCKAYTSEHLELVTALDVVGMEKKYGNENIVTHYINICENNGIARDVMKRHIDYMIVTDFLMSNTDRHWTNFGVLRDSDTLKFVMPVPYFDTGMSMFYGGEYSPNSVYRINTNGIGGSIGESKPENRTERSALRLVSDFSVVDIARLPNEADIRSIYSADKYSPVYIDNMIDGYLKKIEILDSIQKGRLNPKSKSSWKEMEDGYKCISQKGSGIELS